MSNIKLNTIPEALEDLKQGKIIIVVDDEDRENEGDFVAAAELITPEIINFMTIYGRGLICTPLPEKRCEELGLDIMVSRSSDPKETAFTVSIDLLGDGVSTGISASDRAKTIQALMDSKTKPSDFMRPGHIFPLRAKEGGVLKRAGHTEATIDLAHLAGLKEGGVICEIMNDDGSMARMPDLMILAKKHNLKIVSIEDLIDYRLRHGNNLVEKTLEKPIKTHYGDFNLVVYHEKHLDQYHFALYKGDLKKNDPTLVRVQSSSAYFDIFARLANGEKNMIEKATNLINEEGKGVLLFINNVTSPETVMAKLNNFIEFQGNDEPKLKPKHNFKDYGVGIQILKDLNVNKFKIMTQSIDQKPIVSGYDVEIVENVSL
jgi:3,4-dihydroxy 2-butanone 4-phosphate synthase / GTP cyclohydrolase II